jgi:hypothetical protein
LQQPTELQEWLDFLVKTHRKHPVEIESLGLKDEDVLKATLLSPQQLEEIKRNNNK